VKIVESYGKARNVDPASAKVAPLDPACTTYELGGCWVKVLRNEPKNREWTLLHREFFALDSLVKLNRKTLDFSLHIEIPEPLHLDVSGASIDLPYLVLRARPGEPLLTLFAKGGAPSATQRKTIGRRVGLVLARIHSIQLKGAGLINIEQHGVHPGPWQRYFRGITEAMLKQVAGAGFLDAALLDQLGIVAQRMEPLLTGETVGLTHNDFSLASVLLDGEGDDAKVAAVVNFMQAGAGSPLLDLAALHVHCPDGEFWKQVVEGYAAVRSLPPQSDQKLSYYGYLFGLRAAAFFHTRGDEVSRGYFMRRALEAAAKLDDCFSGLASQYKSFVRPSYMT